MTLPDVAEHNAKLGNDPAFDPSCFELSVFDETSDVQLRYSDFTSLLELDPFSTSSKRAFVVRSQNSVYAIARMYQIKRGDDNCVRIFATEPEALTWLIEPLPPLA